jgi:hypothetical protein
MPGAQDFQLSAVDELSLESPGPVDLIRVPEPTSKAHIVTVTMGATFKGEGLTPHLLGKLEWGNGKSAFSADVDVKNGAQLSVGATWINFDVGFDPKRTSKDVKYQGARVSAALTTGVSSGTSLVTRTLTTGPLKRDGRVVLEVPPFAQAVRILCPELEFYSADEHAAHVTLHAGPDPITGRVIAGSPAALGLSIYRRIELAETSRYLTIENRSLKALHLHPTFELGL